MRSVFPRLIGALLLVANGASASAQDDMTISGSVTMRSDGLAVGNAVISVVGGVDTATSDANGRYLLEVPRSAVRRERIQLKVEALGLPAKVIDIADVLDILRIGGQSRR